MGLSWVVRQAHAVRVVGYNLPPLRGHPVLASQRRWIRGRLGLGTHVKLIPLTDGRLHQAEQPLLERRAGTQFRDAGSLQVLYLLN